MRNLADNIFEPDLEEIMSDPIFALLMHRDGVEKDPLLALLREAAENKLPSLQPQLQIV